ncbi:Rad4 family protein [Ascosphaera apis ARSEF 7405]|uniref:Rad4 family protein n=1 Tax=Ascosphaera apis ARSEF 7405 TaxID=392613 RepID=A0A168BCN8_9EURO|nr:Rad4 family protein [Ascosphaera apis ARSEF 7405]
MPPFLPRKRGASPERRRSKRIAWGAAIAQEPEPAPEPAPAPVSTSRGIKREREDDSDSDSSSLSSLSSSAGSPSDELGIESLKEDRQLKDAGDNETKQLKEAHQDIEEGDDEEEEEEEWEDVMTPMDQLPTKLPSFDNIKDIEVTLDKAHTFADVSSMKKGPSKQEREARIGCHCLHVQCLLYHNAIRNAWINDKEVQEILFKQIPKEIHEQVTKWKIACGLQPPPPEPKKKVKGVKGKAKRKAAKKPPQQPDLSQGDPTIQLLRILAAYWKSKFKITAPGLRKRGYRPLPVLNEEIRSFTSETQDTTRFHRGEKIANRAAFRKLARRCEGSRDVGAQLFTALLRSVGIEARMVANLQPIGFGWTKAEVYEDTIPGDEEPRNDVIEIESSDESENNSDSSEKPKKKSKKPRRKPIDTDLPFPIYWTEAISPVTHAVIPVETLVLKTLPHYVATTPELLSVFEPRGAKAEKAKQIIAYVVAFSADKTAKDVTTRYLKRRTWPGKTKGFRIPVEKIPIGIPGGPTRYIPVDWFDIILRRWMRPVKDLTASDKKEEEEDLKPNQPERKIVKEGDTLQSLRSSPDVVLERFLHREEALRPGAKHVRTYVTGKGPKAKEEKVYKRSDVLKCMSAESWRREGRQIKIGEAPLKRVPIRAVTLTRKREIEEYERENGEKQLQGLYAEYQTEYIIPPPIQDGVIPKNSYGNIDCFVPSMVPEGATHLPYRGTVRICKKLGIDFAEAVTGFEFGSKMAVPVITGVVVASENADLVLEAWHEEEKRREERERLKHEKEILSTWRKLIMGARIIERIRGEYGAGAEQRDESNPFTRQRFGSSATASAAATVTAGPSRQEFAEEDDVEATGGGLLMSDDEMGEEKDVYPPDDDEE